MTRVRLAIAVLAALLALAGAHVTNAGDATASPAVNASCGNAQSSAGAQTAHHAGLVIVFGDDRVETLCIEFTEDEIRGAELLRRSGLPVVLSGFGGLGSGVCRIDDVGCSDPADCFCQCRGAECSYWAYYALEDGAWEYLPVGASQRRLHDGDADAWVWGAGRQRPETTDSVCPEAAPAPTRQPPPSGGAPAPAATRPPPATGGDTAASPAAKAATPLPSARATAGPAAQTHRGDTGAGPGGGRAVEAEGDGSSGPPAGLIAFGIVAAASVAAIGGLVVRKRLHG